MLRRAAAIRPGKSEGRITFISSLIGLASTHSPPPNASASASEMKLQVTASSSPRAAAVRRICRSTSESGRGWPGNARRALERGRGHPVLAGDTRDLLDQIGRAFDVTPPARDGHLIAVHREAEPLQDARLRRSGTSIPPSVLVRPVVKPDRTLFDRRFSRAHFRRRPRRRKCRGSGR